MSHCMAEATHKHLMATCARLTKLQSAPLNAGIRGFQRCLSTTAPPATAPDQIESEHPPKLTWQAHHAHPSLEPSRKRRRLDVLRNEPEPRSFSSFLTDNFSRHHNYLRISVTERCNLRCLYCMPEEGVQLSPHDHNLTTPEIVYLSELFVKQGVDKIRLTGGEPTVRKDIVSLMQQIGQLRRLGLKELCITTNGISLHRKLDTMVESGLTAVNLSLDTLDPFQFTLMTRRNGHDAVMKSINRILEMNKHGAGIKLKINCVVMKGLNEREIIPFVELGREKDLEVRFIEYMPFDGNKWSENKMLSFKEMLALIRAKYPDVHGVQDHPNDTSKTYKIPGFVGRIGFITSMTHNFCGTCNRLRITSDGNLKVCLFGNTEVSLRDILRESNPDKGKPFDEEAMEAVRQIESDRQQGLPDSTGTLGVSEREAKLLEVIGMAVKRKKEKHAGIDSSVAVQPTSAFLQCNKPYHFSEINPATSSLRSSTRQLNHQSIPLHLLPRFSISQAQQLRLYSNFSGSYGPNIASQDARYFSSSSRWRLSKESTSSLTSLEPQSSDSPPALSHLNSKGEAHMISISDKLPTRRIATASASLLFSHPATYAALTTANNKKGDAIAVARIAAIQAAKQTANLIPLAHPSLGITGISVDVTPFTSVEKSIAYQEHKERQNHSLEAKHGGVDVHATVSCEGKTGVEMEALVSATMGALTLYDMLKGVDKAMVVMNARVTQKSGGKSGAWRWDDEQGRIVKEDEKQEQKSTNTTQNPAFASEINEWNEGLAEEFTAVRKPKDGGEAERSA